MPDFFNGEVLDSQAIHEGRWGDIDLPGFSARNARHIREPTIFGAARDIRSKGYAKIGAIGFCFGGWAVLRLATPLPENDNKPLVDAIVCAHPSWVVEKDFDGVSVPIMFLAPEVDKPFPDELKAYAFKALVAKKKVQFEWVHFPGVEHGCLTKGDEQVKGERAAMAKGKVAAVRWFKEWLSG
jgi:dienelactone hydrolase